MRLSKGRLVGLSPVLRQLIKSRGQGELPLGGQGAKWLGEELIPWRLSSRAAGLGESASLCVLCEWR